MQVTLRVGRETMSFQAPDDAQVERSEHDHSHRDLSEMIREAMEHPWEFPPLRRALTPDDRITVVVDERLPNVGQLVTPVLEYLIETGIKPDAITLLSAPGTSGQSWMESLPESLEEVRCETHNPSNEKEISYLATSQNGRRLYFSHHLVHADQIIVLCGRRYDPFLGVSGGAGSLFPTFSDAQTIEELKQQPNLKIPGDDPWPVMKEAIEAVWLLGAPFFIQCIEGTDDQIDHVIAGTLESCLEGQKQQDARWRKALTRSVDTLVASISGNPETCTFLEFADAVTCALRGLQSNGRIILLTQAAPEQTPDVRIIQELEDPSEVLTQITDEHALKLRAAWQWATVAQQARIYLMSGWPEELVEDMFAVPITNSQQVQKLIDSSAGCYFLEDAHKALIDPGN